MYLKCRLFSRKETVLFVSYSYFYLHFNMRSFCPASLLYSHRGSPSWFLVPLTPNSSGRPGRRWSQTAGWCRTLSMGCWDSSSLGAPRTSYTHLHSREWHTLIQSWIWGKVNQEVKEKQKATVGRNEKLWACWQQGGFHTYPELPRRTNNISTYRVL